MSDRPEPTARQRVERLANRLGDRDERLAVAESCTGGLVGASLTAVPGASDYFEGGVVAYAYDTKRRILGVSQEALDEYGAVSAPVAREMAQGARDRLDADWGVATTGVAGPSGGTEETPVGTVYVGLAHAAPWGSEASYATAKRYEFDGDRRRVRERTVERALGDLLEALEPTDQS